MLDLSCSRIAINGIVFKFLVFDKFGVSAKDLLLHDIRYPFCIPVTSKTSCEGFLAFLLLYVFVF